MPETVTFASDGLNLSGVVHVPDDYRPGERRPAIIMMHGFGANKNGGPEWICRQFAAWGYVALRFDYRGCGDSEGERGRVIPAEEVADARNAVTYMAARPDVDPAAIALCGSSLGGGVAVQAAGLDPRVAAVIVENGVANGERMIRSMHSAEFVGQIPRAARRYRRAPRAHRHGEDDSSLRYFRNAESVAGQPDLERSLMQFTGETAIGFFMFRPEEFVARIGPRPLLILHSSTDTVTNYEEAFSLVRRAKPPVELHLLDGPTHFMFVDADPRVALTLRNWLERYFPARR